MKHIAIFIVTCLLWQPVSANTPSLPYFASIKDATANTRTGPSIKYPILWVYQRENWPVKVVASFEGWRKIEDIHGEAGWVYGNLLSSRRFVLVRSEGVQEAFSAPSSAAATRFILESGATARLHRCENGWCEVEAQGISGWVPETALWGVK